jgi:hypothetical protein
MILDSAYKVMLLGRPFFKLQEIHPAHHDRITALPNLAIMMLSDNERDLPSLVSRA